MFLMGKKKYLEMVQDFSGILARDIHGSDVTGFLRAYQWYISQTIQPFVGQPDGRRMQKGKEQTYQYPHNDLNLSSVGSSSTIM